MKSAIRKALMIASLMLSVFPIESNADSLAIHGMLLFGTNATYLSHLPMFHPPHDYQLIMKVEVSDADSGKAATAYRAKFQTEKSVFTIVPTAMDLTKLIDGSIVSFQAELYDGHFERGGRPLGAVTVSVTKILINEKLDPMTPEQNKYLVFGENGEYYAAHIVDGKPGHDSIYAVARPYSEEDLRFCRRRLCDPSVTNLSDTQLPVRVRGPATATSSLIPDVGTTFGGFDFSFGGSADSSIRTSVTEVLYSEFGDLSH